MWRSQKSCRDGEFKGRAIAAIWNPPPHDIDTTGRDEELKRWMATPMKGPEPGKKFILYGSRQQTIPMGSLSGCAGDAIKPWSGGEPRSRDQDDRGGQAPLTRGEISLTDSSHGRSMLSLSTFRLTV